MGDSLSDKTDEEIVNLVQADCVELFGLLIERYELKMVRYARKFLSSSEDIKDVVQEIFIKAYKNIESFDVKRKFSSWLYGIAHNELINALKKQKKKTLPLLDLDVFLPHQLYHDNLSEQINRQDLHNMVDHGLDELEFKYREPIVLYYFEQLSYQEIADVMKIPISTVGIRIKRAKEKLKSIYQKLDNSL